MHYYQSEGQTSYCHTPCLMLAQKKERWNKVGLTVSQWHVVTSEAGHAIGMQHFMDTVWDSKMKTNFCLKIMMWSLPQISLRFL